VPLLTVNVGSSSVRLVGYDARERAVATEHLDLAATRKCDARQVLRALAAGAALQPLEAIVHRVVHGGEALTRACRIDAQVQAQI
jgi:acetate kinase